MWPQHQELLVLPYGGTFSCGVGHTYPTAPSVLPTLPEMPSSSLFQPNEPCRICTPENRSHSEAERKWFDWEIWDFLRWAPRTANPSNEWESNRFLKPSIREAPEASLTLSPPQGPPPSKGSWSERALMTFQQTLLLDVPAVPTRDEQALQVCLWADSLGPEHRDVNPKPPPNCQTCEQLVTSEKMGLLTAGSSGIRPNP